MIRIFTLWCLGLCMAMAQDNVGIKFFGLSFHPKGERDNAHLMPNKLDKNAYFVMNLGVELMYEKFIFEDIFSVKVIKANYLDCAVQFAGFAHIGVRGKIFKKGKHQLYGGIGPTFIYRKNWIQLPDYQNPNFFKGTKEDAFQYLFLWYGGEFEYKYQLTNRVDLALSFVPGYPDLMSLAVGLNYRIN